MAKSNPIPLMPWAAKHLWEINPKTLTIICVVMSLIGVGEAFLVLASLGSTPWTVLAQGIALQTGWSLGTVIAIISVIIMFLWIPFKLRFGLGTLLNIILIVVFVDLTLYFVEPPESLIVRLLFMIIAILVFGAGTALYLSCRLGAGPRDGLMVGICQRYGWKISIVRTSIEVTVCLLGTLLGGTLGVSTVVFALSVGWIIQFTYKLLEKYFLQAV